MWVLSFQVFISAERSPAGVGSNQAKFLVGCIDPFRTSFLGDDYLLIDSSFCCNAFDELVEIIHMYAFRDTTVVFPDDLFGRII